MLAILALGCAETRTPLKTIGEPCAPTLAPGEVAQECADGLCVALDTASGFCTRACTDDGKCPDDFVCQAAGQYGKVCRKLTGCKADVDCPSGHSCDPITGTCYIKVQRTLCSPCQDNLQCPQGGACFFALGSGEQFCTGPCGESEACPLGFECKQIAAGKDKALIAQCVPSAMSCNSGKQLCASCEGDAECGGPFDLCVRNVVSGETFCGRDCDPQKNLCPQADCDPASLDSAQNPDCPSGFACANIGKSTDPNVRGPYQCLPNSNTCQSYCDAADELGQIRQCGLGQDCSLTTKSCKPATDGRQCAPCLDNDDCRKGTHPEDRCLVNNCPDCPFKGESFCATPCLDDAACLKSFGPGFVCQPTDEPGGGTRNFCLPQRGTCKSGLGRLGDDCSVNGAQDCVAGVCLVAGNTSLCSLPCTEDAQCQDNRYRCCEYTADGYDCSESKRLANGPKNGSGVCAPLGGLFGDDCTPGRPPCQTGTCLDLGTARVCTVPCALGCPTGFACRQAQSVGTTEMVEVCFPEGGGKAGADCAFGPAACESGLCIRKDSGPVCTQKCTDDLECPADWKCDALPTVSSGSVQACLPPSLQ
jgi:hypothetical protein